MASWALLSAAALEDAYGAVRTEDTTGCLDPGAVEFALRETVGDERVEEMSLVVRLAGEASGGGQWQLALTVSDGSGTLWNRIVPVEPADCPYLTDFVARSFERGLADLPLWGLYEGKQPVEFGAMMYGALPVPARTGAGLDLWIPAGVLFAVQAQLSAALTSVQRIEPSVGFDPAQVSYVSGQIEIGPGIDLPRLRLSTRAAIGIGWAEGLKFASYNGRTFNPRVSWMTDAMILLVGGYLRMGPRFEVPALGARYIDRDGVEIGREIPARVGLVIGISGPLGKK